MTPQQAIAMLDRQLASHGQTVELRKSNAVSPAVAVKAFVRGGKSDEVAGTISQTIKTVVVSPTGLDVFGFPAGGGYVVMDGAPRAIVGVPELVKLADVVVRINVAVKG